MKSANWPLFNKVEKLLGSLLTSKNFMHSCDITLTEALTDSHASMQRRTDGKCNAHGGQVLKMGVLDHDTNQHSVVVGRGVEKYNYY